MGEYLKFFVKTIPSLASYNQCIQQTQDILWNWANMKPTLGQFLMLIGLLILLMNILIIP